METRLALRRSGALRPTPRDTRRTHPHPGLRARRHKDRRHPDLPHTALVAEARTRALLDPTVCRPGILIYRVATRVPSGRGPLRIVDATPHSGGCYRDNKYVDPELTDATFQPGDTYTDRTTGAAVTVLTENPDGTYRVRVTPARD